MAAIILAILTFFLDLARGENSSWEENSREYKYGKIWINKYTHKIILFYFLYSFFINPVLGNFNITFQSDNEK